MRNMYTAPKIMVKPANTASQVLYLYTPNSNKNSPINPLVSGNATLPNTTIINKVLKRGATLRIPPRLLMLAVWVRFIMISAQKNKPTTFTPCAIICATLPCKPSIFKAKIPADIKPT